MRTNLLVGLATTLVLVPIALLSFSGWRDRPGAFFGGGPFTSGELVTGPEPDWGFLTDTETIEMQLLDPPRSRVVWVVVHDGRPYIVSGFMGGLLGRLWKHWPAQVERDDRAIIRVDGKRYERRLVRITSGPEVMAAVSAELDRKYGFGGGAESIESGGTWLFELAPR